MNHPKSLNANNAERKHAAGFPEYVLFIGVIVTVCLFIFYVSYVCFTNSNYYSGKSLIDYSSGWYMDTAEGTVEVSLPFDIDSSADQLSIYRTFTPEETLNRGILFDNQRQIVLVSLDDVELFSVNHTSLYNVLEVLTNAFIRLPALEKDAVLRIIVLNDGSNHFSFAPVHGGFVYEICLNIIKSDIPTTLNVLLQWSYVVALAVIIVYLLVKGIREQRFLCLLMFNICTSLWGFTDSSLCLLFRFSPELYGVLCYLSLMLMPLPILYFNILSCETQTPSMRITLLVMTCTVILQCILSYLSPLKLNHILVVSHLCILVVIVTGLVWSYSERKHSSTSVWHQNMFGAYVFLCIMTLVAIVAYWLVSNFFSPTNGLYRGIMLIAVTIYFWILVCIVITSNFAASSEKKLQAERLELYEALSMQDNQTGLGNRRAFEEHISRINTAPSSYSDALLIMLDLNGLKSINDQYGHTVGDELIVSAAGCIRRSYENFGSCYRVGGDEFTVIIEHSSDYPVNYRELLNEQVDKYNSTSMIRLSIAYGASTLRLPSGNCQSTDMWRQEADIHMYEDKRLSAEHVEVSINETLRVTLEVIINALEARDVMTTEHSRRVQLISEFIAEKAGLTPATVHMVSIAARLHDIGKIAVPDAVLFKPDRLSDEEFDLIKSHSAAGARLIAQTPEMQEIAGIVLHHHERFDGTGYPDGLSGSEIPLASRIIAIADAMDTMLSRRSYKHEFSLDYCHRELEQQLGTQFDPALGRITLENWTEIAVVLSQHPAFTLNTSNEGTL